MNRPKSSAGMSLLELLIVVSLILILVGAASYEYTAVIAEQKIGKAGNELHEFVKALKAWENRKGMPVTEYVTVRGQRVAFTLDQLKEESIMPAVPDDPWSMPYGIDTTRGIVFSWGPDSRARTPDDIVVPFRPPFELQRASQEKQGGALVIEFSRAVDRGTITTQNLKLDAGGPVPVTTFSVDIGDPYRVKAFLLDRTVREITVTGTSNIKARDGTALDISRMASVKSAKLGAAPDR